MGEVDLFFSLEPGHLFFFLLKRKSRVLPARHSRQLVVFRTLLLVPICYFFFRVCSIVLDLYFSTGTFVLSARI